MIEIEKGSYAESLRKNPAPQGDRPWQALELFFNRLPKLQLVRPHIDYFGTI